MPDPLTNRVCELVEAWCTQGDTFMVEVRIAPGDKIQVFIDADDEVSISKCVELSRHLEGILEEEGVVNEHYSIEVSSPGGAMAFKLDRQYKKNLGREVEVVTNEGMKYSGVLKELIDKGFVLTTRVQSKSNKKQTVPFDRDIAFSEVKSVKKVYNL